MSSLASLLLPAFVAAAIAYALNPLAARFALLVGAIDMPGHRKIHQRPIPRLGGLAVVTAIALVWLVSRWALAPRWQLAPSLLAGVGLGLLPILVASLIDDIRGLSALPKLAAHVTGAAIAVSAGVTLGDAVHLFGASIAIGLFAAPLSMLWIVGVTNAFNIIDGLDGLSAGLALIAAIGMAAVFMVLGQPAMGGAVLVLAGALAGFLPYNVHPARMFLGDTGATAIGFCLATFALKGGSTLSSGFAALLPVFIMGLPIADTLISMARRVVTRFEQRRGGVFVADRNHIHHRLLALGIDHGRAVLMLYGAGLLLAGAAFISMFLNAREASLFVVGLLLAGFVGVNRLGYDEFAFIRKGTVLKMYEAPVVKRSMFVVFADITMTMLAAYIALGLKGEVWSIVTMRASFFDLAGTVVPITVLVFWKAGLYRGSWRLAGVEDLMRVCTATAAVTVLALIGHLIWSPTNQSFTVFLIYGLVGTVLVTGSRASYVILRNSQRRASNHGTPVLLYGAGTGGVAGVRELFEHPETGLRPIGFVDDDEEKVGKVVSGLPVLGTAVDLATIIKGHGVRALLVSTSLRHDRTARAKAICQQLGVSIFKLDIRLERIQEGVMIELPVDAPRPDPAAAAAVPGSPTPALDDELAVIGTQPCLACGSRNVHRSKARNLYERFKKLHTGKRLYRCHACRWRGWLLPLEYTPIVPPGAVDDRADLSSVDRALGWRSGSTLTPSARDLA